MRWKSITIAALLMAVPPALWAAQVYQWTDANGVKHYSNTAPPEGADLENVEKEIATDPEASRRKAEREAAVIRESEAMDRQRDAADREKASQAKAQKAIEEKQAELDAVGEKVWNKRKYLKRHGRQDINAYRRLGDEIEALKADPTADPQKIKSLEAERAALKEKIYTKPRRSRKGARGDVLEYQQIERELNTLKKTTPPGANAPE